MRKLNLNYGDVCVIKGTCTELDNEKVRIIGVATRHILDTYIVEFTDNKTRVTIEDGVEHEFRAITLPEGCLAPA